LDEVLALAVACLHMEEFGWGHRPHWAKAILIIVVRWCAEEKKDQETWASSAVIVPPHV
jgi:hypothetical protein